MSDERFECVLPFETDDPSFALGFEAGRIWERLREGDLDSLNGLAFHAANVEMVHRMRDATPGLGQHLQAEFTEDANWMVLRHVH